MFTIYDAVYNNEMLLEHCSVVSLALLYLILYFIFPQNAVFEFVFKTIIIIVFFLILFYFHQYPDIIKAQDI